MQDVDKDDVAKISILSYSTPRHPPVVRGNAAA